jgi:hypothetical protein
MKLFTISLLSWVSMIVTVGILASVGYDMRGVDSQAIFWVYLQCTLAGYALRKLKGKKDGLRCKKN